MRSTKTDSTEERPIDPLISALIDAAHDGHYERTMQYPKTQQYSLFQWQLQEAAAARQQDVIKRRTSGGLGGGSARNSSSESLLGPRLTGGSARAGSLKNGLSEMSFALEEGGPPTSNLEVTCEYDANFQAASITGRSGVDIRPLPHMQLGPVATLFRWYTKRASQFMPGYPLPGDLTDAPPIPPPDILSTPSSTSSPSSSGKLLKFTIPADHQTNNRKDVRSSHDGNFSQASSGQCQSLLDSVPVTTAPGEGSRSSTRSASRTSNDPPGNSSASYSSPALNKLPLSRTPGPLGALSGTTPWAEGLPPRGGRSLNRALDPVISMTEMCEMLEELDVVPHHLSRQDVVDAFKAALKVPCTPIGLLPFGQVRPEELRYPQFCDTLIRLAIAADAKQALGTLNSTAHPPRPAREAVKGFMEMMDLANPNIALLKRRLDALARMAGDRGAKKNAIKWMYISPQSAMSAARSHPPELPGNWNVDSHFMAPAELHEELLSCDAVAATKYIPSWKEFPLPALDMGVVQPGELRSLRVVLRNRSQYTMTVRVDTSGAADYLVAAFREQSLPPGVPRVIDVDARFLVPGEYMGEVRIYTRNKVDMEQHVNSIPFYALVPGEDPEARFPKAKSERSTYSVKGLPVTAGAAAVSAVMSMLSVAGTPHTTERMEGSVGRA
ncbi:hypothetical protein CEUSTIGMA_g3360.t1 [Chlamydomonas eustigma]|uniref:Uncharacterized protein n=1 Tax=Chlamydomonas eustigma TaxID=1157962 RepID=A0A250WYJ5_9CHLO|nr:hypothetical protein CEUSTIGMA_g3360.t1 [Chlamydomonas eustigma]|eukprot:GAX75917.1 hypothetical protein CEUSTIGMA_g3360.t1 [Chlamydomonas eustigma]